MPVSKLSTDDREKVWNDYCVFEKETKGKGKQKWIDEQAKKNKVSTTTIFNILNRFRDRNPLSNRKQVRAIRGVVKFNGAFAKAVERNPFALVRALESFRNELYQELEWVETSLEALNKEIAKGR